MTRDDDTPPPLLAGEGRVSLQYLADLRRALEHGLRDVGVRLTGIETRLTTTEQQREVERYKIDEALKQIVDLERQVATLEKAATLAATTIAEMRDTAAADARRPMHWSLQALIVAVISTVATLATTGALHVINAESKPQPIEVKP